MRISSGRLAIVAILALPLATACAGPHGGAAPRMTASGDLTAHYSRAPSEMSACFSFEAMRAHPDLEFDMTVSPPLTTAAKKYRSDTENVWAVEFHEAAGGTDVVLRKGTGAAAELDALWPLVERCG